MEQESGFFFNMKYFEDEVHNGNWDEVEKYLSGFTKVDDNRYSMKIFFEIRKQKYLEALDKYAVLLLRSAYFIGALWMNVMLVLGGHFFFLMNVGILQARSVESSGHPRQGFEGLCLLQ